MMSTRFHCNSHAFNQSILTISDSKALYHRTYCKCTEKHDLPAWCGNWADSKNYSWCILYGGLKSRFCPGAEQFKVNGSLVDYFSYDVSVCNLSESKYFVDTFYTDIIMKRCSSPKHFTSAFACRVFF